MEFPAKAYRAIYGPDGKNRPSFILPFSNSMLAHLLFARTGVWGEKIVSINPRRGLILSELQAAAGNGWWDDGTKGQSKHY
jgi:hypothetical protein